MKKQEARTKEKAAWYGVHSAAQWDKEKGVKSLLSPISNHRLCTDPPAIGRTKSSKVGCVS